MNAWRPSSLLLSVALGFVLPVQSAAQESAPTTAFILDTAARTVTALDVVTAKPIATVNLEGEPTRLLRTKGGARLVVLERGPGKPRPPYGVRPTGKSAVTVIDPATMKALARFELGWGLGDSLLTDDGARLLVACPGFKSNKPPETLGGELVTVDLMTPQIAGRVALERPINSLLIAADGRTALAFSARETGKKPADNVPAELRFVDLPGPTTAAALKFDGAPGRATLSPEGKFVYLLDVGSPATKKLKAVDGRLHVVSLERREIQKSIDVGTDPRGLVVDPDDQQVLILSDGPPTKERNEETGELRVVRGSELVSTVKVATRPSFSRIAPDRDRLHVVGSKSLTTVDYSSFHVEGNMPLQSAGVSFVATGGRADELAITPDGKRGFVLYSLSSKVAVLDLASRTLIAAVTTGRGGVKFGKFMASVAASAAVGAATGMAYGPYYYAPYDVYNVAEPNTSIAVRPDGKFAYVLNTQTNDVTIVDAEKGAVVDKIAGAGHRVQLMTAGGALAIVGPSLTFIDTTLHKAVPELTLPGLTTLALSPDGRHGVALLAGGVACLDGSTGKVMARAGGFKQPAQVLFNMEARPSKSAP